MKYTEQKLEKYIDIISGFAFKTKDFSSTGVPIIKIKNITPPSVTLDDLTFIPTEIAENAKRFELHYDDVLIAMTGSHINQIASVVGRVARVKYNRQTMLNQRVGKVISKNASMCNIDFVYYFLSQDRIKMQLALQAGGAANQANISPTDIKNLIFPCPDIKMQNRIANILRAYDDLIENNQKQIKLLEEAAMRLYKEWFVDFRFPGHKKVKIVDGVPRGWEKKKLGDIINVSKGKTITHETAIVGDVPVIAGGLEPSYFHNVSNVTAPVITISASGANAGYVALYFTDIWASDCSYISITDTENIYFFYLYMIANKKSINNLQRGSAQPHVYPKDLMQLPIIYPKQIILYSFSNLCTSIFLDIGIIKKQISLLRQARDKLLPKIMSGEIEV